MSVPHALHYGKIASGFEQVHELSALVMMHTRCHCVLSLFGVADVIG